MADTLAIVIATLREKFQIEKPLSADSSLKDLGMDSLDQVNFLFTLEEKTGVKIPDADLETHALDTLGSFAAHIERLRGAA
jgi:acyl carrier protein